MKLYLASTSFDDVRWASACGLLDGVVVTPMVGDEDEITTITARALEIVRVFACPVLVTPGHHDVEALYREARDLARETDEVTIEYPLDAESLEALHRAASEGLRVAAGGVMTTAQALVAARAGAVAVLVDVPELEADGRDAATLLTEIRRAFDVQQAECELTVRHVGNARQVATCAAAGVDAVIIDPGVLRGLLARPAAFTSDTVLTASAVRRPRPV